MTGLVCDGDGRRHWANAAATLLQQPRAAPGDGRGGAPLRDRAAAGIARSSRLFDTYRSLHAGRDVPASAVHHAA